MSDLISRQAAIDAIVDWAESHHETPDGDDCIMIILDVPSAQLEIIRCKDCKHRYVEDMIWHCPFGLMGGKNFFCGYGSLGTVEMRRDG